MFSPKIEITNPEAIKLLNNLKSGVLLAPYKAKLVQYKWYIFAGITAIILIIALAIGKAIAGRSQGELFFPPDLTTPQPTTDIVVKSKYEPLRQQIIYFNTELPDPVIPPFDNIIDLEVPTL